MVLAEIPLSLRLLYTVRAMMKNCRDLVSGSKGNRTDPGYLAPSSDLSS